MELDKIYEKLGLEKLDENVQKEIKTYLDETIDLKAKEIADSKLDEEKEKLVEEYEQKFEQYKEDMTSKFSNFVDDILEKELQIPDQIKEYARLGEEYQPLIESLTTKIAIDNGKIDEKAKGLLKESKEEIESLRDKVNDMTSKNMELSEDAKEMASHIYLMKKCEGLTESKKEKIVKLLENVKDKEEIDRKFKILTEGYEEQLTEKTMYCSECDKEVEVNEEDDEATCPDCGGTLTDQKKGKVEEEIKTSNLQDRGILDSWLEMINNNRF